MKNFFKCILLFAVPLLSVACTSDDVISDNRITPVMTLFYQNADELAKTYDPDGKINEPLRITIFDLYKQGAWSELEALFDGDDINKR